jgi:hypothetical protein
LEVLAIFLLNKYNYISFQNQRTGSIPNELQMRREEKEELDFRRNASWENVKYCFSI